MYPSEDDLSAVQIEKVLNEQVEKYFYASVIKAFTASRQVYDKESPVCILLGGTSGCGKSTLASILASRLGINTVVSTDNIRHMLRSVFSEDQAPFLFRSSYECSSAHDKELLGNYENQSSALSSSIKALISRHFNERKESIILEGVHLSPELCKDLLESYKNCFPFIVFVGKSSKHAERFAIRSKYMTLEPNKNKYMKFFENIRCIQNHLCLMADKFRIPKLDNTNFDRSLGIIHRSIISYMVSDMDANEHASFYNEFLKLYEENWRSKEVLRIIRQKRLRQRSSSDVTIAMG